MDIPEIITQTKPELRSENVAQGKAMERPPVRSGSDQPYVDAVNKYDDAQSGKQSNNFTRDDVNSMVAEAEEYFANNAVKLKFNVLEENDTIQVEILDSNGKTIRKIPDDDFLKLTESLKNIGNGVLDEVS